MTSETEANDSIAGGHVLVIPSEEFQPPSSHLAGIFQLHQCLVLRDAGYRVGVLSVRLEFTVPMLVKACFGRLFGQSPKKGLEGLSVPDLVRLAWRKIFSPDAFVQQDTVEGVPTVRASGFYGWRRSDATDYRGWVRAGLAAFAEYQRVHGTPDLVHAHNSDSAGLLALQLNQRFGLPYVLTEHSSYFHRRLIPASLLRRMPPVFENAAVVGVVSPRLRESLVECVGPSADKATWMPNVLDSDFEKREPDASPREDERGPRFLSIGELIPLKGHAELVEAFIAAYPPGAAAELRIAGDGALEAELNRQVEQAGPTAHVRLLGRIDRAAVLDEIDACDCLVLPSHYETFGVVLIEALSRGKPVIATACGGPDCIVESHNGVLVPVHDQPALIQALRDFPDRAATYDPVAIRADVLRRFGARRLLTDLQTAYATALAGKA